VTRKGVALGSDLNIFRSPLNGPFLAYYVRGNLQSEISKVAQGDSVVHLYPAQLERLQLAVPPTLGEQEKIADCLTSLDDLIRAEGKRLAALKDHKRGLMQRLFPRPDEATPRLRFPEFRGASPWEVKRLWEIADVLQGYGFPERYQGKTSGKFPFYKVSDISNALAAGSFFIGEAANYVDEDDLKALKARTVPGGATIFAKIGEAIRSNRRAMTTRQCVIDNNTAAIKSKETRATDLFLFYLFSKVELIDYSGGVVPSVNKTSIENIEISCPDLPEQRKIADCLSSLDDLIRAQDAQFEALRIHKCGLMQQLFPREIG
jgi:type I restriction enzyme S subunit